MKGINPIILNSIFALVLVISVVGTYLNISPIFIPIFLVTFILCGVIYAYCYIKIESLKKGRLIHKITRGFKFIKYDLIVFSIILLPKTIIRHFVSLDDFYKTIVLVILSILFWGYLLFRDYIIWTPTIKFYEKGVVFGNTVFYKWDELNIYEKGNKIKIKIKYYPKEVVLDKNILKGVNYERN